ncbi:hypothetical protein BSL78_10542 [Apostichopus japonicus]|uniref:NLR family CARD domain-containing protein 4 n=1 Tax=Stichopus japonicus TaxID=307972 RepID=A0A2G8KX52_STIJA|nr:hypothetical protein BSL78_10542 [Apostichopus japonicus]
MANTSPATENVSDNTKMHFGSFKVRLAELLTIEIILSLATFFMFPPAKIDELRHAKNSRGQLMVSLMEERGQIKPNDISPLLTALDKLERHGLLSTLHRLFPGSEEGGIEMHGKDTTGSVRPLTGNRTEAVKLKSYRDVFNDDIISSKRILLEGDPGYGKSTFTLQAAYDWCTATDSSPLKGVDIFILLPLRLLGGILSICLAIKLILMPDYSKLNKLLFDALTGKNQQIVWQKNDFKNNVGDVCYNELITIGILIEDDISRFACGLNKKASSRIIKYLKGMKDGQSFASLCFFEQVGEPDDVVAIVKDLLTGGVTIGSTDSRLLQRSTIQILDIAAKSDIPITSVCLDKSFKEFEEDVIVLHSGHSNQLLTVEKIHIETEQVNEEPRILTRKNVQDIRYGLRLTFKGAVVSIPLFNVTWLRDIVNED